MGPHNRAPRNPTRDKTSSRNIAQTWHYILKKLPTALNNINALQTQRRVYCSSRVRHSSSACRKPEFRWSAAAQIRWRSTWCPMLSDLFIGERANFLAKDTDCADQFAPFKHRHD